MKNSVKFHDSSELWNWAQDRTAPSERRGQQISQKRFIKPEGGAGSRQRAGGLNADVPHLYRLEPHKLNRSCS